MDVRDCQLIRLPEVMRLVGLSRSTVLKMVAEGAFPAPILIGKRAVAWRVRDVIAWIEDRPPTRPTE